MENIIKRQNNKKEALIEEIKKRPIIEAACKKIGIGRATFYRWRKADEKFAEQIDYALNEGKSLINDMAESQLLSAIRDRNLSAIIFWLKNHHGDYKNKVEINGKLKTEQQLTPEQEAIILKALKLSSLTDSRKTNT